MHRIERLMRRAARLSDRGHRGRSAIRDPIGVGHALPGVSSDQWLCLDASLAPTKGQLLETDLSWCECSPAA